MRVYEDSEILFPSLDEDDDLFFGMSCIPPLADLQDFPTTLILHISFPIFEEIQYKVMRFEQQRYRFFFPFLFGDVVRMNFGIGIS